MYKNYVFYLTARLYYYREWRCEKRNDIFTNTNRLNVTVKQNHINFDCLAAATGGRTATASSRCLSVVGKFM